MSYDWLWLYKAWSSTIILENAEPKSAIITDADDNAAAVAAAAVIAPRLLHTTYILEFFVIHKIY